MERLLKGLRSIGCFSGKSRAQDFEEKEKIRNFQDAIPPPS